jgi:DNA-binding transcriptional MerR regulator
MDQPSSALSIQELSDRTGTPVRTIRFYISERLLPGPEGRGTATAYTEDHFRRLLLIRQLSGRHVPLNEIRDRLESVGAEELAQVLAFEEQRGLREEEARASSPREYISALLANARAGVPEQDGRGKGGGLHAKAQAEQEAWRRVKIATGIELHFTVEAERRDPATIEEILESARQAARSPKRRTST